MLTKLLTDLYIISLLDDEPNDVGGMSSAELKAKFDEAANTIKTYINESLIPELAGTNGAESVGIDTVPGLTGVSTVQAALAKIEEQMAEMTQGAVADESITTAKLAALAVTSAKLAAAAVETDKIQDGAVTSVKLADLAVTAARLADLAVETAKIKDKAVTTEKIADKAVTTAQLGDASVGTAQLDALSVTAAKLAALAVDTAKINAGAVTRAKLAQNALYSPMITIASNRNVLASDLGVTINPQYNSSATEFTLTLNQTISTALPTGFEFATVYTSTQNKLKIATSGIRVLIAGEGQVADPSHAKTFTIPEIGGMVAFKKIGTGTTAGDLWVATGNVEVVS